MAAIDPTQLSPSERSGLCCVYASLVLNDAGMPLSEANLLKIIKASGNKVDATYVHLFAKSMEGQDLSSMLSCMAAPAAAPAEKKVEKKAEPKKEKKVEKVEEKKEEKKEEDVGGFGDIFGGDS